MIGSCQQCGGPLPPHARGDRQYCDACRKTRQQAADKQWRKEHPEQMLAFGRKYDQSKRKPRNLSAYNRSYYQANKERIAQKRKRPSVSNQSPASLT